MKSNGANGREMHLPASGSASSRNRSIRAVPEPSTSDGPDQGTVISMVRHSLGPVLDGLGETKGKVSEARRLHEIAESVGDHEVAAMVAQELNSIASAARIAS